jgi:hypothetical protein
MTIEKTTAAARAILQTANAACAGKEGFAIIAVNCRPGDPMKGNPSAVLIAWIAGPVWGELKFEFMKMPQHILPADALHGVWARVNGTAVTPAGFPMLPALSALLADIATAAARCADVHFPRGCHYVAAAE